MPKANAVSSDDEVNIIAMEESWTFTEEGEVISINGMFIMKVLEKDKNVFKNADEQVVSLPATHYKDGWSKMDMIRKRKLLKLWRGNSVHMSILNLYFNYHSFCTFLITTSHSIY